MGRNYKRNMKLQLKVPLTNKSNKKYLANLNKERGLVSSCNNDNSGNLENANIEPALINHIKNIRNVDEKMLIWNINDRIDKEANEQLHSSLNIDMVMRSMQGSPFAGYLRKQIDQLNKVSRASLSGVVIMPFDINSVNDMHHVVNNATTIKDTEFHTFQNICAITKKDILNISTENVECDVSNTTESTNKTDLMNLSPIGTVRTSGRSAKKNYLDMLQQPFTFYRKIPGLNSEKSKIVVNSENGGKKNNNSRKSKRRSKLDITNEELNSPKKEIPEVSLKKEKMKKESTKKQSDDSHILVTNFEQEVNKMDACDAKMDCEETQYAIDNSVMNASDVNVIQNSIIEDFDKMVKSVIEAVNIKPSSLDNDKKIHKRKYTYKLKTSKPVLDLPQKLPVKRVRIRLTTIKCIICEKMVEVGTTFSNMCLSCSPNSRRIMSHVRNELDLVCICDPPCWSNTVTIEDCEACIIQRYIDKGIEWNDMHWSFIGLTTTRLRSSDMVERAKETMKSECEGLLSSCTIMSHSCVLSNDELLTTPCQWTIKTFRETDARDCICDLCKEIKSTSDLLYCILPSKEHHTCHQCLMKVFLLQDKESEPCTNNADCNHCLLVTSESLFPVDAVRHRYERMKDLNTCRLCHREDQSLITIIRSQVSVCLVCVWRIKVEMLSTRVDKCNGHCPVDTCGSCLVDMASHVIPIHKIISHCTSSHSDDHTLTPVYTHASPTHGHASPTNGHASPTHGHASPTHGHASPTQGHASPNHDHASPNHDHASPNHGHTSPTDHLTSPHNHTPIKHHKKTRKHHHSMIDKPPKVTKIVKPNKNRPKSLTINAVWPELSTIVRERRITKPTQFADFFVGDKDITQVFGKKKNSMFCATGDGAKKNTEEKLEEKKKEETEVTEKEGSVDNEYVEDDHEVLDLGDHNMVDGHESIMDQVNGEGKKKHKRVAGVKMKKKKIVKLELPKKVRGRKKKMITGKENDGLNKVTINRTWQNSGGQIKRRIKQAMFEVCEPVIVRTGGPRVKQVSRIAVSSVDLARQQKCVVKQANRGLKMGEKEVMREDRVVLPVKEQVSLNQEKESQRMVLEGPSVDDVVLRSSSSASVCVSGPMSSACDQLQEEGDDEEERSPEERREDSRMEETVKEEHDQGNVETISEDVKNVTSVMTSSARLADLDVYRDSDNEDVVSEEENIDPDLDSINIVKPEVITASVAYDGGYPIITSRRAMPNKVLCYSCGSGGDQMIHCVSCAEPFHFFCIEFQFRPKSKEMFVCRNCTKCHSCHQYGSDLKCIKCQLGFHPACVDKYPPSRSADRSNWACYKCAMCLHCGTKAEEAMHCKDMDWTGDPWQCGRCARAKKHGLVCPDCGRSYQEGVDTVDCSRCTKSVHRQCVGLTEDEYQVQRDVVVPDSASYECTECEAVSAVVVGPATSSGSNAGFAPIRSSLRRQCKQSGLKMYCEGQVTRRIGDYIGAAEAKEERLLDKHNMSAVVSAGRGRDLDQMDGAADNDESDNDSDDDDQDYDEYTDHGPIVPGNSSSSIDEYDIDHITTGTDHSQISMQPSEPLYSKSPSTKTGIFSRLMAEDFLTPKHMLMESLARIMIKLGRYSPHSAMVGIYHSLMKYMKKLNDSMFPWVDFDQCLDSATEIVKCNSARTKLVIKVVADTIRDGVQREMDVFSLTVWEIEDKLLQSLVRGREDFIVFHSEQNLAALNKSLEYIDVPSYLVDKHYCRYKWAHQDGTVYEDDIRRCALCGQAGDDGLEGRLIYGLVDVWVHVNCALWSDEVYESDDGALVNVDKAIIRGQKTVCASCSQLGATVQCSDDGDEDEEPCQHCYHFNCAFNRLRDPVFTDARTFYCSEMLHAQCRGYTPLGLADMLILRRIYVPMRSLARESVLTSDEVVVTVGTLRVERLGRLEPHSDCRKVYLCPVEYRARRLFWSQYELDSLVMYNMRVSDDVCPVTVNDSASIMVAPPVPVPSVTTRVKGPLASNSAYKRRRVIDTVDSRQAAKRPRGSMITSGLYQSEKRDIVYEMDDDGNLMPIEDDVPGLASVQRPAPVQVQSTVTDNCKVNRRFPKQWQVATARPKMTDVIAGPHGNDNGDDDQNAVQIISIEPAPPKPVPLYCPSAPPNLSMSRTFQTPKRDQRHCTVNVHQGMPHSIRQGSVIPVTLHQSQYQVPRSISLNNVNNDRRFSLMSTGQRPPPIIIRRTNTVTGTMTGHSGPATIIRIPSGGQRPQQNTATIRMGSPLNQQVVMVTKLNAFNRPSPTMENNLSVLRTVLTTDTRMQSSSSSSSSLAHHLPQYDGEADDDRSLVDDSVSSQGSDRDTVTTNTNATTTCNATNNGSYSQMHASSKKYKKYSDYDRILKFTIEGFTTNKTAKSAWTSLVKKVARMRALQGFTEYPLRVGDGWAKFGLSHRALVYLVEQMVGAYHCHQYEFKYHKSLITRIREQIPAPVVINGSRTLLWVNDQPDHIVRDPLAFLRCKSNCPPKNHAPDQVDPPDDREPDAEYIQRLAIQFRKLKSGVLARVRNVNVCVSDIHGRGLFARREFSPHEIIIEYVGETIRSVMSDLREIEYQKTGVDCYMFRLDQHTIVDATYKGNAARFINHSCQPNCYAKVVKFEGEKHIIIIAQRRIYKGEELTYDYRFPLEDDKLVCTCGSRRCRKYLN